MATERPTLLRHLVRQHLLAASVTITVMLVVLLFLADHLALHTAAYALVQELRQSDASTVAVSGGPGRGGRLVLDATGVPVTGMGWMHGNGRGPGWRQMTATTPWSLAPRVLARGEMQGNGTLPWTPMPVVWAARATTDDTGTPIILLAWTRTSMVRGTALSTYLLVIGAVLIAFLVSMVFMYQTMYGVTRTLTTVTEAGRQMAAGDFAVVIPPQPTAELHQLSTVITDLASSLDSTLGNLRTEHARLQQMEQAQRQFVADASHELRAPLSTMALTLDAWHDGLLATEERPEAMTHLRTEVKRLGRMVAQLLDLSRIETGRQPITLEALDIHAISIQVLQSMAALPGAPITLDISDNLPPAHGDRDAVHRILRNLLDNARRFTPPDGVIRVWAKEEADGIFLGVTDTGCGIPESVRHRVWDRFARAERERAADDAGTGLGLAIVKALAEAMGGHVDLTSAEGQGTTVWVSLTKLENESEV